MIMKEAKIPTYDEIVAYIEKRIEELNEEARQYKDLKYPYNYDAGHVHGACEEITELHRFILNDYY